MTLEAPNLKLNTFYQPVVISSLRRSVGIISVPYNHLRSLHNYFLWGGGGNIQLSVSPFPGAQWSARATMNHLKLNLNRSCPAELRAVSGQSLSLTLPPPPVSAHGLLYPTSHDHLLPSCGRQWSALSLTLPGRSWFARSSLPSCGRQWSRRPPVISASAT